MKKMNLWLYAALGIVFFKLLIVNWGCGHQITKDEKNGRQALELLHNNLKKGWQMPVLKRILLIASLYLHCTCRESRLPCHVQKFNFTTDLTKLGNFLA